jgi:hypothetical protein
MGALRRRETGDDRFEHVLGSSRPLWARCAGVKPAATVSIKPMCQHINLNVLEIRFLNESNAHHISRKRS